MKRNSFGLLFFIKKGKPLKSGLVPIFLRVTVNGVSVESSTRRTIRPEQWNKSMECSTGRDRLSIEVNEYIRTLKLKLYTLQSELELSGAVYTSRLITDTLFGCSSTNNRTLLSVFRKHNAECRALIGIDFVDITVRRYDNCAKYLAVLIREKYGKEDMALSEINGEFVRNFEFYLKTVRGCQQNTVIRYMKCFKKIIHLAIANEWLRKDPFTGIKFKEKQVNKEIHSMEELEMLLKKEIEMPRIEYVRYVFFILRLHRTRLRRCQSTHCRAHS